MLNTESGSSRSPFIALIVVLVAVFMELLDATILSVAAPSISASLGTSESELQWTIAGYTLALGAGLIIGGRVGDQFGRRRAFLLGLAGFTIASLLCALASNPMFLISARIAQGLMASLMIPQVFGIIRSSFTSSQRAKAYGAYGGVLGLASVAGPLLGGLLVNANLFDLGWRTIFGINVPIGIIGLLLGIRFLPESREHGSTRLDLIGALLAALATVLVLLPLVQGREWGWPWWSFALLALSIPTTALFIVRENRLAARGGQPILDPALFRIRAFTSGLSASLLFFGCIGSYFFLLSLYLQIGTERNALETGMIILPYAIGSLITSGIGVQFANRAGRALLVSGSLLLALSQLLLLFIVRNGADPSYWALALPMIIGGLGIGLTAPILVNVILAGVPVKDAGAAGAVLTTVGQIGNTTGVAILGVAYFTKLNASFADGANQLIAYGDALTSILPWQIACYVIAAGLMFMLPSKATNAEI
ncbi:MFS transporter [Paenibacillus nasutitermitis]|uniref:MFS transporter n=1 Tax=Paenibacillus nasutitermitis TaxID=1652958 RepID=A0A916YU41_9BACL|nr:MFS transporter [Paenibacillus nasutitermitis]GGD61315.1 MFS transporter [Paenibacillus nasutitermitis]